jgi:hypothetical protein
MHGSIEVVGWKAANEIAQHLIDAGYQVLITSDGERLHEIEYGGEKHLAYKVAFTHPKYDNSYFEIISEDHFEGTRTWDDIKDEMKQKGEYPEDILEGLEHLDQECKDCKVEPTKEKK